MATWCKCIESESQKDQWSGWVDGTWLVAGTRVTGTSLPLDFPSVEGQMKIFGRQGRNLTVYTGEGRGEGCLDHLCKLGSATLWLPLKDTTYPTIYIEASPCACQHHTQETHMPSFLIRPKHLNEDRFKLSTIPANKKSSHLDFTVSSLTIIWVIWKWIKSIIFKWKHVIEIEYCIEDRVRIFCPVTKIQLAKLATWKNPSWDSLSCSLSFPSSQHRLIELNLVPTVPFPYLEDISCHPPSADALTPKDDTQPPSMTTCQRLFILNRTLCCFLKERLSPTLVTLIPALQRSLP